MANLQPNPRCEASDKELEALYQQALPLAVRLITEYVEGSPTAHRWTRPMTTPSENFERNTNGRSKAKILLTSLERAWILYDVGNSAFVLLVATLIPIFFNALAEGGGLSSVEYLAYWGYAASAVTGHHGGAQPDPWHTGGLPATTKSPSLPSAWQWA